MWLKCGSAVVAVATAAGLALAEPIERGLDSSGKPRAYMAFLSDWLFLPPHEYDHPFPGEVRVIRGDRETIKRICYIEEPSNYLGCSGSTSEDRADCVVVVLNDDLLRRERRG
jgi:hypothetical protein